MKSTATIDPTTGRVTIDGKSWGKVRRNQAGETIHAGGRVWIALNRNGQRVGGTHMTQKAAVAALAASVGKPLA